MTDFENESKVEILEGGYLNMFGCGPHPPRVHADEVELMDEETWRDALRQPRDSTS